MSQAPAFDETTFRTDEDFARDQYAQDPLGEYRERFIHPTRAGKPLLYFCGNSLGLQPTGARAIVDQELQDWGDLAVDAHFEGTTPWYDYHEVFRDQGSRVVGAQPDEVVMMNSLTVNLHLMMVSFYRPENGRRKILMEAPAFPSDMYAIRSHMASRGEDPDTDLIVIAPREGEHTLRTDDVAELLESEGDSIALVLFAGVNFFTGQVMEIERITALAQARGCRVGWDLAHAAGNVPLQLHAWNVDFACWCSYKYLNAGPGAIAGCFVHERHAETNLPRFAGWWGNDPATRFRMHLEDRFIPRPTADGWQISNPPILAMAPLRASLDIFDQVGMDALRQKSVRLTGYLRWLIEKHPTERFEIITPRATTAQGCQLSILVHDAPRGRFDALQAAGVVGDFRPPNVIRVAPVPLYNTYLDAWRFADILAGMDGSTP